MSAKSGTHFYNKNYERIGKQQDICCTYSLISFVEWWKEDIKKSYDHALMEGELLGCDELICD